jgi:hypothetical protein
MNLELTDEQTEALIRELSHIIDGDRYPPQSTHCGTERDPWEVTAGGRPPGTAAPATTLRAAEQGAVREARLE